MIEGIGVNETIIISKYYIRKVLSPILVVILNKRVCKPRFPCWVFCSGFVVVNYIAGFVQVLMGHMIVLVNIKFSLQTLYISR